MINPRRVRYTPHYRQKLAGEGRRQRLLKSQEEVAATWHKTDEAKDVERRVFKKLIKKVRCRAQAQHALYGPWMTRPV